MGLEEEGIYANIERSSLMKISTRPELFPCFEVIAWILPRVDVTTMILENVDKQGYAAYSPGYVALAYHLPEAQVFLSDDWLNNIRMDLVETLKRMLLSGKHFRTRPTGEYDTASLRAQYRFIALMLNRIFWESPWQVLQIGMDAHHFLCCNPGDNFQLGHHCI